MKFLSFCCKRKLGLIQILHWKKGITWSSSRGNKFYYFYCYGVIRADLVEMDCSNRPGLAWALLVFFASFQGKIHHMPSFFFWFFQVLLFCFLFELFIYVLKSTLVLQMYFKIQVCQKNYTYCVPNHFVKLCLISQLFVKSKGKMLTPLKSNIDIKNGPYLKPEPPFPNRNFGYPC